MRANLPIGTKNGVIDESRKAGWVAEVTNSNQAESDHERNDRRYRYLNQADGKAGYDIWKENSVEVRR